jgi:hypothetical protein
LLLLVTNERPAAIARLRAEKNAAGYSEQWWMSIGLSGDPSSCVLRAPGLLTRVMSTLSLAAQKKMLRASSFGEFEGTRLTKLAVL